MILVIENSESEPLGEIAMKNLFASVVFTASCAFSVSGFTATIFVDQFDSEGSNSVLNYNSFSNWSVLGGSVDLIASGGYGISCFGETGSCVDLDGTSSNAGVLTTNESFYLTPGEYTLSFGLSGNQRTSVRDSVTVSLGSTYSEVITLSGDDPFELFVRNIAVTDATIASISFDHAGGDNYGLILDEVSLAAVPIPASGILFLSSLLAFLGLRQKQGRAKSA